MKIDWIPLVLGCAMLVVSVYQWRHRDALAKATAERQQALFGDPSKVFQRAATGNNIRFPAVGAGVIGLVLIALAIVAGGHS